jgi:acyl carrier protein
MTREAILDGVATVAERHLGWKGELRPEMHLVEDLELDSLRLLTLAVEVENHFRVCLDEEDEAVIETVGDLVRIIEKKTAE